MILYNLSKSDFVMNGPALLGVEAQIAKLQGPAAQCPVFAFRPRWAGPSLTKPTVPFSLVRAPVGAPQVRECLICVQVGREASPERVRKKESSTARRCAHEVAGAAFGAAVPGTQRCQQSAPNTLVQHAHGG